MTPRASCSGVGEALSAHPPHSPSSSAASRIDFCNAFRPTRELKENPDPCATADRNCNRTTTAKCETFADRRNRGAIANASYRACRRPGEPPLPLPQHRARHMYIVYGGRCQKNLLTAFFDRQNRGAELQAGHSLMPLKRNRCDFLLARALPVAPAAHLVRARKRSVSSFGSDFRTASEPEPCSRNRDPTVASRALRPAVASTFLIMQSITPEPTYTKPAYFGVPSCNGANDAL